MGECQEGPRTAEGSHIDHYYSKKGGGGAEKRDINWGGAVIPGRYMGGKHSLAIL